MRASPGREQVVDRLYDAVLSPGLWPDVVQTFADLLGGAGAALLSAERPDGIWVRTDPAARTVFEARFVNRNPIAAYAVQARRAPGYRPMLVTDEEILPGREMQATDFYNEFLGAYDGPHLMALDLGVRGMSAALNVCRTARAGGFTDDERAQAAALHPHLIRAFWLTVQLGLKSDLGGALGEYLDRSDQGVAAVDRNGQVLHANPAAQAILARRDGLMLARGLLTAHRHDDRATLSRMLFEATQGEARTGGWMAVRRDPPAAPLSVAVTPLGLDRPALFEARAAALVCIVDPDAKLALGEAPLRRLFGLTAAQARLAARLAEGQDLAGAAADLGVSLATARTHLQEIFARTQTNRQSELVRLLVRAAGISGMH